MKFILSTVMVLALACMAHAQYRAPVVVQPRVVVRPTVVVQPSIRPYNPQLAQMLWYQREQQRLFYEYQLALQRQIYQQQLYLQQRRFWFGY
jgi:hypothetical protein